jgi:hypothetical protein
MTPQKQGWLESAAAAAVTQLTAGAGYACGLTMEKLPLDAAAAAGVGAAGVRYAPLGAAGMVIQACWLALLHLLLADLAAAGCQLMQLTPCCGPAAVGSAHCPCLLLLLLASPLFHCYDLAAAA